MAAITSHKLRQYYLSLPQDIGPWYQIYHQYIVINLLHTDLESEILSLLKTPIIFYVDESKNYFIQNNILFYYLLYSPEFGIIIPQNLLIKRSKEIHFDLTEIFKELITIIKNHQKKLPIKSIYTAIKSLLPPNICQKMFHKNVFIIEQYCQLIDISTATYKRAS